MRTRRQTRGGQRITRAVRMAGASGAITVAALFAACANSDVITNPPTGGGSVTSSSGATSSGDGGGGVGGAPSSSSSVSSASGGGGGDAKCVDDEGCKGNPKGGVCNTPTGECVECLPSVDICAKGSYCDPATNTCESGCVSDADCTSVAKPRCDPDDHICVPCVLDADCQSGTICISNTCIPGCSDTQPCPGSLTCCSSMCVDVTTDINNCGACLAPCADLPHAGEACEGGTCVMQQCEAAWGNCDLDPSTGCEWNVLQDGDCLCQPGEFTICYNGPVGSLGLGPCKAGVTFCEKSGVAWGPCNGQVLPAPEICANNIDEDCNGVKDDAPDADNDGFSSCNGDCCDVASAACPNPELVNPGAFEVVGNGIDDDCDPTTSDAVAPAACSPVQDFAGVTASDVAKAMDICQTTTAAPPIAQKKWGLITAQQLLANGGAPSANELTDMQNWQSAVLTAYGTGGIVPQKGPTMAGLSTGRMRDEGDAGYQSPNGGVDFNWDSTPPAAYLSAHGGLLPSSAGCSGNCPAGTGANDSVNVRLKIRVPTNAKSFSYDFRFVSAEYWAWTCTNFNDFYLALLQTTAPGIPADKNISFDGQGNPVSVNNGFFDVCLPKGCYDCPAGNGALAGTGMQLANTGGATKWLTTDAPVTPGETMQLELIIFDVEDNVLDSLALLDNFRWNLTPSSVVTHE